MRKIPKSMLLFLVTILLGCSNNPEGFTVNMQLDGISDGTVFYLKNLKTGIILDSCKVQKGGITLRGRLDHPEKLFLQGIDQQTQAFIYTSLLIGNDQIQINAHKDDFPWNIDATGSPSQDQAELFNQVEYHRQVHFKQLREKYALLQEEQDLFNQELKKGADSFDLLKVALIKKHFNTYAALENFKYYKNKLLPKELARLYSNLSAELKATIPGQGIKTQLEFPAPEIGDSFYDYKAINQNGDSVVLSEITQKFILLHFSSVACFPSQSSLPEVRALYKQYKDQLEIVTISQDTDRASWEAMSRRDSIIWMHLWDGKGDYGDAVLKYGTIGTPNYILLSPERTLLEKWFGYRVGIIREKLEPYL